MPWCKWPLYELEQVAQRGDGVSILEETQNLTGLNLLNSYSMTMNKKCTAAKAYNNLSIRHILLVWFGNFKYISYFWKLPPLGQRIHDILSRQNTESLLIVSCKCPVTTMQFITHWDTFGLFMDTQFVKVSSWILSNSNINK